MHQVWVVRTGRRAVLLLLNSDMIVTVTTKIINIDYHYIKIVNIVTDISSDLHYV